MRIKILLLILGYICILTAISFRKVAVFNRQAIERGYGFDTDHDGRINLILSGAIGDDSVLTCFWENVGYDRYVLEDTCHYSQLFGIGYLDNDSFADMVGLINGGWNYPTYVYESPDYSSNPTLIVWGDSMLPRQPISVYIANLDGDTLHEMLMSFWRDGYYTAIYETRGDNQYQLVWEDTIRYANFFTWGDFDLDGKTEFISQYPQGYVYVWECCGDDNYQFIFMDTLPHRANYDVFYGNDLDGNGRPEFLFSCVELYSHTIWLYAYEAVSANHYEYYLIDSLTNLPLDCTYQRSWCGDIDGDKTEEIIWSTFNQWHIYKAISEHQYQRLYTSSWTNHEYTTMDVYDLNQNRYREIIEAWVETGIPSNRGTIVWEIEGVNLHIPNGGEFMHPGDTCLIRWEKFDPPGADSFALFFSADSGRTYDTVALGLPGSDTSYVWTVPDTMSDSCLVMIWAYGPPRSGEQTPRGTAWDFSDSLFSIRPMGINDHKGSNCSRFWCDIYPNPSKNHCTIEYALPQTTTVQLTLYDASGRMVKTLINGPMNAGVYRCYLAGKDLPAGVYFLRLCADADVVSNEYKIIRLY